MKQIGVPQIHMIPFDLGVIFLDVLSIDNSKNILFAESFCQQIEEVAKKKGWGYEKLFKVIGETKKKRTVPLTIKHNRNDFADQAICKVILRDDLYCYILSSGVGMFLFADLDCIAMRKTETSISNYSKALIANYQKKITQSTILDKTEIEDVCPELEELMLEFRELCWGLVLEGVKHKKIQHLRPFSGNKDYKTEGLSYVLTIYLFAKGEVTGKEMNHLLCSPMFGKVMKPEKWAQIDKEISLTEPKDMPISLDCGSAMVYASWSAVAVETPNPINTLDDIRNNEALTHLLKVESYVQSRWFVADNSMDNVNKNATASMESLQRIASLMEFCQAELDNEISANMGTLQKSLLKIVVETSAVKQLYKSVLNQIKTQLRIKEAHYEDKKRKNRLIADLCLAVFTATSLYKTVLDIVEGNFGWWNWLIFGGMMVVAVGTIIFNYKNK